jgi:hypothetical protein
VDAVPTVTRLLSRMPVDGLNDSLVLETFCGRLPVFAVTHVGNIVAFVVVSSVMPVFVAFVAVPVRVAVIVPAEKLPEPSRATSVLTVLAVATPVPVGSPVKTGVSSVGVSLNTATPVPVSSVMAPRRLALDGVPSHVATPVPSELRPVPPRVAASWPVHPTVIEVACRSAVAGVPPSVSVTFVSSVLVSAAGVLVRQPVQVMLPVVLLIASGAEAVTAGVPDAVPHATAAVPAMVGAVCVTVPEVTPAIERPEDENAAAPLVGRTRFAFSPRVRLPAALTRSAFAVCVSS